MGERADAPDMPGRKRVVSDAELTDIVREREEPVISTADVAEQVSITHHSTRERLETLHRDADEAVQRTAIGDGATNHAWWTPRGSGSKLEIQAVADRVPELDEPVRELELPGTDVVLELRRAAVQMAYDHVDDNMEQSLEEIVDYLMRRNPAGFRYRRTALRDMILESMRSLDGVEVEEDEDRITIER